MIAKIIFINGTINSGKSTIARMLAAEVPSSVYLDGDDFIERNDRPFEDRISRAVMQAFRLASQSC